MALLFWKKAGYRPVDLCFHQTVLREACWRCRKTSGGHRRKPKVIKEPFLSCLACYKNKKCWKCCKTYSALSRRGLSFGKNWWKEKAHESKKLETLAMKLCFHIEAAGKERETPSEGHCAWQRSTGRDGGVRPDSRDIQLWLWYLIKIWIIPPPYSSSVCVPACVDFHHWFDVVTRQLAAFNDPNSDLYKGVKKEEDKVKTITLWNAFSRRVHLDAGRSAAKN